ncbi:MAG TPA: hypothetical protein VHO95_02495, partial [Candidatus Dormibacteraeota bacterium]|nr:hypothetical protein [Candidatus Dormibacteraeota bacterium]
MRYLQLAFEPFHSSGEWADIEKLQRRLLRDGDSIDIYAIGDRIPSELGINPIRVDNRCQLTAAGISVCKGSDNEIRDFLATVQLAARKYLADEQPDPTQAGLSSDELRDSLGLDELAIRRVFRMIEWEPFIAGGEGAADGTWRRNIATSMRHFIRVATFDEY